MTTSIEEIVSRALMGRKIRLHPNNKPDIGTIVAAETLDWGESNISFLLTINREGVAKDKLLYLRCDDPIILLD